MGHCRMFRGTIVVSSYRAGCCSPPNCKDEKICKRKIRLASKTLSGELAWNKLTEIGLGCRPGWRWGTSKFVCFSFVKRNCNFSFDHDKKESLLGEPLEPFHPAHAISRSRHIFAIRWVKKWNFQWPTHEQKISSSKTKTLWLFSASSIRSKLAQSTAVSGNDSTQALSSAFAGWGNEEGLKRTGLVRHGVFSRKKWYEKGGSE